MGVAGAALVVRVCVKGTVTCWIQPGLGAMLLDVVIVRHLTKAMAIDRTHKQCHSYWRDRSLVLEYLKMLELPMCRAKRMYFSYLLCT